MKCNVCGRELKDGQMFCQCGNTVGQDSTYGTGSLNVNAPSSGKIMLVAIIAGFLTFAIIIAVIVSSFLRNSNMMTDRSKWENISRSAYSITLPGNMKESDIVDHTSGSQLQHLDTFRSGSAIVDISVYHYTADQKKYLKRQAAMEIVKDSLKTHGTDPKEHGEFIYVEFPQDSQGVFMGSDKVWTVDAMYITHDSFYEIEIFTPMSKHEKYNDAVFAMLDSFRPKSE